MWSVRVFVALCCLSCRPLVAAEPVGSDTERPNIVLMMVDDLGFSDFGCYGGEIDTPHIDALAAGGLRLSQFYNTAKCHSSRICLLTGKYPFQAGNNAMDRAVTVAEVLQANGYFTAMAGKWHLNQQPTDRGFQRYWGHLSGSTNFFRGDNTFRLNGEQWDEFDDDFYTTDANVDFAIRFIDEGLRTGQPFFQYIAFNAPHYPLQARQRDVVKYAGRYADGWDSIRVQRYRRQVKMGLIRPECALSARPDYIPAWEELTTAEREWESRRMEVFATMVDSVDQNIGRLVDHLKRKGVFENTLIMLCSDNGGCPFERTRGQQRDPWDPESYWCYDVGWAHASNTPFRWYKQNQHEGGISSPMIVHWPARLSAAAGSISHQPGHLIDLLPTCLDVAAATYPTDWQGKTIAPVQGRSLLPLMLGETREPHDFLYFQFSDNRAIRQGDWKAVSARGGAWELYDLSIDRTELDNLALKKPDQLQTLVQLWHQVAADIDGAPEKLRRPAKDSLQSFPPAQMTRRAAGPKAEEKKSRKKSSGKR